MMGTGQNGWILDYDLMEGAQAPDLMWPPHLSGDQSLRSCGIGLDFSRKEEDCYKKKNPKKKARVESKAEPGTKACREKMRRDRLNDMFAELCLLLDPEKPPKSDKIEILSEATRLLSQLRNEEKNLKEANESLKDSIKNMKAEKVELRDEKVKLKAEKERLEQIMEGLSVPFTYTHPPAAFHSATSFDDNNKTVPSFVSYPPIAMWQWMSPAAIDTSEDHKLRPPVA